MDFRKGLLVFIGATALLILASCGGQRGSGGGPSGGQTISGKLVDVCNQPLAYITVAVPGHDPVLTGADGSFTIENVQTPYDLVVNSATLMSGGMSLVGSTTSFLVYEGLTKTDPYLMVIPTAGAGKDTCAYTKVEGTVSNVHTNSHVATALFLPPYKDGDVDDSNASFNYTRELHYDPAAAGEATLLGVGWTTDAHGKVQFYGADAKTLTLTATGGSLTGQDLDLSTKPLGNRDLTVRVQLPSVMSLKSVKHYLTFGGINLPIQTREVSATAGTTEYTVTGPTGASLGSLVSAQARYGGLVTSLAGPAPLDLSNTSGSAWVWQRVSNGAGDATVTLPFPDPVIPVTPLNGATIDPANTAFHWVGPDDHPLYNVMFVLMKRVGSSYMRYLVDVVTSDDELRLPDLGSLGFAYDDLALGAWYISAVHGEGLPATADDLASSDAAQYLPSFFISDITPAGSGYTIMTYDGWFFFPNGNNGS